MPRDYRARENQMMAKAKRASALKRGEMGRPTVPRVAPASATSATIKAEDPALRKMIDEHLARRQA